MTAFVLKRVGFAFVTLFAVLTLVFFLVRILPGDPAMVILGDQASMAAIEALRARLGLDQALHVQYWDFLKGVLTGDWGVSMVSGRPVIDEILKVLPATLELTLVSLILGAVIGVPLGIWAAINRNAFPDYLTRIGSLLGLSFPAFVSAILLLLVFAIALQWFPVISSGQGDTLGERLRDLALPAINLGLIMAAYITRVTRSSMLEVLGQDFVRTARAKGVPWRVIVWRHCLRNALIPVITVVGLYLGILIGNSVLTEIVFNRPGLGKLIVGALNQRDYTMLQGMMVIYTLIVVAVNLVTDLTYGLADPRVKYE
jgi:peptide/nickel transport system permease protein